jgi:TPP-dependent 2-oxoacid decarboxylase
LILNEFFNPFVQYLNKFVTEDDIILADTGCSFYALQNLKVAESCYIGQLSWGAIGYTVAANIGAKLANDDKRQEDAEKKGKTIIKPRRAISICGDGAFAESLNEIGTIRQLGLNSVIFVMANSVFAIEQWLVDAEAFKESAPPPAFEPLCEVPQTKIWDWVKLAEGFGGVGYVVNTNQELATVLTQIGANTNTFSLVAVKVPCKDIPCNMTWKTDPNNTASCSDWNDPACRNRTRGDCQFHQVETTNRN